MMETQQHTCTHDGAIYPKQCSCGQWWTGGRAVPGFVARKILAETPVIPQEPDPGHRHQRGNSDEGNALEGYVRLWKSTYGYFGTVVRAAYWEMGSDDHGLQCQKSYLSIGPVGLPPHVTYGAGSMLKGSKGDYKFTPPRTPAIQRNHWGHIERKRLDHQYRLVAQVLD